MGRNTPLACHFLKSLGVNLKECCCLLTVQGRLETGHRNRLLFVSFHAVLRMCAVVWRTPSFSGGKRLGVDNRYSWPSPGHRRKSPLCLSAFGFSGLLLAVLKTATRVLNHAAAALSALPWESHHPLCHPLRAQDSGGRRSINWLYLLDH